MCSNRYELVSRNLQEILGDDRHLNELLKSKPEIKVFWGTATTGKPHIAYFVPARKIADILRAGCKVVVLIADLHAYLDETDLQWDEKLSLRANYYERVIKTLLQQFDAPLEKLEFVRGRSFQLSKSYVTDVFKLLKFVTERDAKKAGSEVVKTNDNTTLAGLLYPCLQSVDEMYLDVDCHIGGVDQRKIFTFAEKYLPKLGCKKKILHLMTPMVQGLTGSKMSSSSEVSKIDLLDDSETVIKKINKAFCESGNADKNGVLSIAQHIIFPSFVDKGNILEVEKMSGSYAQTSTFTNFQTLKIAFEKKEVHPKDLKKAISRELNRLLDPIRTLLNTSEFHDLTQRAYPI